MKQNETNKQKETQKPYEHEDKNAQKTEKVATQSNRIDAPEKTNTISGKEKTVCAISYIWLLFFLPLIAIKQTKFAKFHANQALVLCIVSVVGAMIIAIFEQIFTLLDVQMVGTVLGCIWSVVIVSAMLFGIITAAQGKMQELPIIGKIKIVK